MHVLDQYLVRAHQQDLLRDAEHHRRPLARRAGPPFPRRGRRPA
jgi:hypothetical protein